MLRILFMLAKARDDAAWFIQLLVQSYRLGYRQAERRFS